MNDIPKALIVLFVVGVALTGVYRCAHAGEWFPEAAIYLDVTRDSGDLYCGDRGDHASHLGARVDLWSQGPHTFRTLWVHGSCVETERDLRSRDTIGIGYEYRLW